MPKSVTIPVELPAGWKAETFYPNDTKVVVVQAPKGAVTVDLRRRGFALGTVIVHRGSFATYKGHGWEKRLYLDAIHALKEALK